ncbi:hypothetical protein ACFL7D_11750, partial [candidate division KSB1 bacterium]
FNSRIQDSSLEEEEDIQKEDRKKTKTPEIKRIDELEEIVRKDRKKSKLLGVKRLVSLKPLYVSMAIILIVICVYVLKNLTIPDNSEGDPEESISASKAFALMITERNDAIIKFKEVYLDPDNPLSKNPMTLELRSMSGDTYGELFDKVYRGFITSEEGLNTLGAFWRNANFGPDKTKNDIDLMNRETSGELLLFPNPASFNLKLLVEEGDAAYQYFNNIDPDIEIGIWIDGVIIK